MRNSYPGKNGIWRPLAATFPTASGAIAASPQFKARSDLRSRRRPQQLACRSALGPGRELPLARLDPRAQLPRNRYNSFFVSASELEGEKGIRVAPVANPILR